jgi:pSer/pThr/pTyr-binding forkhead associated (FHA) protein
VTSALGEVVRRRLPGRPRGAGRDGAATDPTRAAVLVAETPGVADVPLARPTIALGRDPRADAVVDHPGVSWRHLTLTRRDARTWTVADTGSTNGTLVAGRRIAGLGVLHEGDTLGLGHDGPRFRLVLGPVAAPGPRPTPTRREGRPRQEVA